MMELNKDDLYEIEKILDVYASSYTAQIDKLCNLAINCAINKQTEEHEPKIKAVLNDVFISRNKLKKIRDKLEKMRLETNVK